MTDINNMSKEELRIELAAHREVLKVATVSLASQFPEDFQKVFGQDKLRQLVLDSVDFAAKNIRIENMLFETLYK